MLAPVQDDHRNFKVARESRTCWLAVHSVAKLTEFPRDSSEVLDGLLAHALQEAVQADVAACIHIVVGEDPCGCTHTGGVGG